MQQAYDAPFYKVLSRNDTGETGGHQGGVVIPRRLSQFFPDLALSENLPTADHEIVAELFDGGKFIGLVHTRFQMQTWKRERTPEFRLTRNLRPLMKIARAGDILMFERAKGETRRYKLTLIRNGTDEHKEVSQSLGGKTFGTGAERPASQQDFSRVLETIEAEILMPFEPYEESAPSVLRTSKGYLRVEAFTYKVRLLYRKKCALCRSGLLTPNKHPEVDAAHIIRRGDKGTNDPRNGVALCKTHHWAFDRYLWTLADDYSVIIPKKVIVIADNKSLGAFDGQKIALPADANYNPALAALAIHRNIAKQAW